MSLLDIGVLAFFVLAVLQGASRGVIAEVLAVGGVIGAFVAASRAGGSVADKLVDTTGIDTTYADPIGFSMVFLLVIAAVSILVAATPNLLRRRRRKTDDTDHDGGLNKKLFIVDVLFGAILAPIRPAMWIATCSLVVFTYIQQPDNIFGKKSAFRQLIINAGHTLGDLIPANHPFSRKGVILAAPRIDDNQDAILPAVKDQKGLDKLIEDRMK